MLLGVDFCSVTVLLGSLGEIKYAILFMPGQASSKGCDAFVEGMIAGTDNVFAPSHVFLLLQSLGKQQQKALSALSVQSVKGLPAPFSYCLVFTQAERFKAGDEACGCFPC